MQINVAFRHTDASPALRDYAEEKISRVKKYMVEPIDADIVLKVEKFRHIAEVSISANGIHVNGVEETEDMYSAIDMVADKIESQLKKYKDKLRGRKSTGGDKGFPFPMDDQASPEPISPDARVITTEQLFAKPMDIDEALMQLDLSNGEFLVFTNRRSNNINVLYRRKDGNYGLIEPTQ